MSEVFLERRLYPNVTLAFKSYLPEVYEIDTDLDTGIDVDQIEAALNQGKSPSFIYIISDGHNPLGVSISLEKRKRLAEIAGTYNIPLIEDDAYGYLSYEEVSTPPVKLYAPEQVFYLGSFSKMLSPALRLGWMIVPEAYRPALEVLKEASDLSVSNLSQHILNQLLSTQFFDSHLQKIKKSYKEKRDAALEAINRFFPVAVSCSFPSHGFFIWIEFPERVDTQKLQRLCLENYQVSFLLEEDFAVSEQTTGKAIRLCFATTSVEKIYQGIALIGQAISDIGVMQ